MEKPPSGRSTEHLAQEWPGLWPEGKVGDNSKANLDIILRVLAFQMTE